ncbi:MAG: glycosyltransferase, partial [Phycisphaeraceae bacterium]
MTSTPPIQPTAWGKMRSPSASQPAGAMVRPQVRGRFLFVGDEKLYLHGVTYGTFRPNESGDEYPPADRVNADFAQMAAHGINALRTYTVPPRWFLDLAERHGLRVMVGLPWEQHITFLDEQSQRRSIQERVRAGVRACAGHPAVLAFALGNEIPAPIVRWYGAAKIERFLLSLYRIAKAEDPEALVTYVNFPSTEYLDLPFVDFACFNVYLEQQDRLEAYLGRLHSLYHNKPLVMAEVGLDSDRNGLQRQAEVLSWQVASCFASGCSGLFVFAWTDEWHRGGYDVLDWAFGLTDRERRPKPALARVADAFTQTPFPDDVDWPRISVVVCTYNGSATLAECLDGLGRVDYPDYEVIVVNDGSTDRTAEIARRFECRVVDVENGGLSRARNIGMKAASGPIVAYIDDDAWPDPQWLRHLAWTFLHSDHVAVGGPNVPPLDDGFVAACVAHAPGSPTAVLLTDDLAEHIPGCNMA